NYFRSNNEKTLKESQIICKHCNGIIDAAYNKCPYCGADLSKNEDSSLNKNPSHSSSSKKDNTPSPYSFILEQTRIRCPYCDRTFNISKEYDKIKSIRCKYCDKKISKRKIVIV
ncbi:MAG: hypothetical protein PQJ46_12370, partial [Spirochaetales bacterium]|nr:hypothetical protein [Spirochaetales bacterium]